MANKHLPDHIHAQFSPSMEMPIAFGFQYNPKKLRIVDMLEEQSHWHQIRTGQHLRSYGTQNPIDVLEILAKQRVLQHPDMTPTLIMEWKWDIQRVKAGQYTYGPFQ